MHQEPQPTATGPAVAGQPTASRRSARGDAQDASRLALPIAAGLAALSLFWMASEQHLQSCVQAAQAKYPAIAVSALTGRQTGPLKVSYVRERAKALEGCGHFF